MRKAAATPDEQEATPASFSHSEGWKDVSGWDEVSEPAVPATDAGELQQVSETP